MMGVGAERALGLYRSCAPRQGVGTIIDILVTNDDGFDAPGIRVLAEALKELGKVTVVAPAREMSAASHALTISEPVRFERAAEGVFSVEGTPADCVSLAVGKLLSEPPDIVVSGINRGANVGDDITYSGTVARAREAAMLNLPTIAVSLARSEEDEDYTQAAQFATELARDVGTRRKELGRRTFLNVNVPVGKIRGVRITTQGRRDYWANVEERVEPRSRVYSWLKQGFSRDKNGMSDLIAVRGSYISVTPLQLDFTDHDALEHLESWNLTWNGKC